MKKLIESWISNLNNAKNNSDVETVRLLILSSNIKSDLKNCIKNIETLPSFLIGGVKSNNSYNTVFIRSRDRILELLKQELNFISNSLSINEIQQLINELPSNERGNLSDTYHTFNELYDMRLALTAKLFNMAYQQLFLIAELTDRKINDVLESFKSDGMYLYKSKNHSDGIPVWDNWFIVVANFGEGQISFYYEMKDWDLFQIEEINIPPAYDNHTTQDVINRLKQV